RLAEHRPRKRRGRVRAHRPWRGLVPQRPAQGPQRRTGLGLVHRRVRHRLPGVLHHRPVPAAPARAAAAHDLAAGRPGPGGAAGPDPDLHPLTRYQPMRAKVLFAVTGLLTLPAYAAELEVTVEIPKLHVAAYLRPFVVVRNAGPGSQAVAARH